MAIFTWVPTYSASMARKPQILSAFYGDNYQQDVGDGINNNPQVWQLTFDLALASIDAIDAFLSAQGATIAFDWTPPRAGASARFKCQEWTKVETDFGTGVITAKFKQVFGQ